MSGDSLARDRGSEPRRAGAGAWNLRLGGASILFAVSALVTFLVCMVRAIRNSASEEFHDTAHADRLAADLLTAPVFAALALAVCAAALGGLGCVPRGGPRAPAAIGVVLALFTVAAIVGLLLIV